MMMSWASRRAALILAVIAIAVSTMSFSAWSQGDCVCDYGTCTPHCIPQPRDTSFQIPLGSIVEALATLAGAEIPPGLSVFIPNIEITLHHELTGDPIASCLPAPCCHSGVLSADVWLYMEGKAKRGEYTANVESVVRVKEVQDNTPNEDEDPRECVIQTGFSFSQGGVSISLVMPGGTTVDLLQFGGATANVGAACEISCGCSHGAEPPQMNHQPILSLPTEVVMSAFAGETYFAFEAWDPDGDPLWIGGQVSGVNGEVAFDLASGRGTIRLLTDVSGGTSAKVLVDLYDLKQGVTVVGSPRDDQFYHTRTGTFELRFISNHPP